MNIPAIIHTPKSSQVYAYDYETLHVRIKTAKDDVDRVTIKAGDPFDWVCNEDTDKWEYDYQSIKTFEMKKEGSTQYHDIWFAELTGFKWLRIRYGFILGNKEERLLNGCHTIDDLIKSSDKEKNINNYFNFPYINEKDVYTAPTWVQDTVWYQISPGSYSKDGESCVNYWEGTIEGMIKKLDYIHDMGFTGIYLTPIFESSSWHKYNTTDYLDIDKHLGDKEVFRRFVDRAHSLGIRVMLDAVFNHCGYRHAYWQDVLEKGRESEYFDYFCVLDDTQPIMQVGENSEPIPCPKEALKYRTFAYEQAMPKWNTANQAVRDYLIGAAVYWIKEFGIDGWRLDVSNEVSHDFWREFRKAVKGVDPQVYLLGENWDNANAWLRGDQYDAVMNYEFAYPVWNFFGLEDTRVQKTTVSGFVEQVDHVLTNYPKNVVENMYTLIGSHDVSRMMTVCKEIQSIAKLMFLFMMTYTGAPSVFYGDEIGMTGDEQQSRNPMVWDEEQQDIDLKDHIKRLIELRNQHASFKAVDIEWVMADDDQGVVVYKKQSNEDRILVIINNSESKSTITMSDHFDMKEYKDLYTGRNIRLHNEILLKPYEFYILAE